MQEDGALAGLEADERVVAETEVKQLRAKVRELERLLGKKTMESEVEGALSLLLDENQATTADAVHALVEGRVHPKTPAMVRPVVDLNVYDALLEVSA